MTCVTSAESISRTYSKIGRIRSRFGKVFTKAVQSRIRSCVVQHSSTGNASEISPKSREVQFPAVAGITRLLGIRVVWTAVPYPAWHWFKRVPFCFGALAVCLFMVDLPAGSRAARRRRGFSCAVVLVPVQVRLRRDRERRAGVSADRRAPRWGPGPLGPDGVTKITCTHTVQRAGRAAQQWGRIARRARCRGVETRAPGPTGRDGLSLSAARRDAAGGG